MSRLWVVVADQSRARFFTVSDPRGPLMSVGEIEHPEAREKEQTLTSDKPGRAFDSAGAGRHAMGTSVEPGKAESVRFARQVADHVRAAHNEGRCDRVLLVAGSPMLGMLRDNFRGVSGLGVSEVEKNLGKFDAAGVRSHLPERL